MIEYLVVSAAEKDSELRMALSNLGAKVVTAKPLVGKIEVLRRVRAAHQQFVENLFAPKDESTQPKIDQAYNKLLEDLISPERSGFFSNDTVKPSPELDLPKFKAVLQDIFLDCNSIDPYCLATDQDHTKWSSDVLRPSIVQTLVYFYNLDGQERTTIKEVGIALGRKNRSGLRGSIDFARSVIKQRLHKQQLMKVTRKSLHNKNLQAQESVNSPSSSIKLPGRNLQNLLHCF